MERSLAYHYKIGKDLKAKTYFTRPYTFQDKGTVENKTGVIRRFFLEKADLIKITPKEKKVEKMINYIPIRKLNYLNPIEVLNNKCVALMS